MLSLFSISQTKYTITLNTSDNLKDVINDFTSGFETYNRYILDSATITFSSNHNFTDEYFNSISYEQRNVISVVREKLGGDVLNQEKAGGNNCEQAQVLCSSTPVSANSGGFGIQELNSGNRGCLAGNEHQSSWYYVNVQTGGSLTMLIDPNNNGNDYDFAVWGPYTSANVGANCPPISGPIRCSWSAETGNTGMIPSYTYSCWSWDVFVILLAHKTLQT